MKNQILDEDFAQERSEGKIKIASKALDAVLIAALIYFFILLLNANYFEIFNPIHKAFLDDSLSIIHLLIAMAYLNYKTTKGDYELNVKGGYYILLFGSGFFFIGALLSIFDGFVELTSQKISLRDFWKKDYKHLIVLIVIFMKFLLIKPIAILLKKTKKHVPGKK